MKKTKIDWCDTTINPVVGCKNGCKYCYARKINDRFHFVKNFSVPQFFPEKLKQLESKKRKAIFIDSMSDFSWWTSEQATEILKWIEKNPQHAYIFLTKCLSSKMKADKGRDIAFEHKKNNIFIGQSITTQDDYNFSYAGVCDFLSIEPILSEINLYGLEVEERLKAVIIGAETGNRKGKIVPKKEWVDKIVRECDKCGIKVFMKESIRSLMGSDFRQDTLPWYE